MKLEKEFQEFYDDNFEEINCFYSCANTFEKAIETVLEKLEINILNNEDDWCRNSQSAFELFKNNL